MISSIGILALYILVVFLSFKYIKIDTVIPKTLRFIIVLSGSNKLLTKQRLDRAFQLNNQVVNSTIVVCGKYHSVFMKTYLERLGIKNILVQSKSTNTFEDALFSSELLPIRGNTPIALVTSPSHQRRAYNTFQKVYHGKIYNYPCNILHSVDGILSPIGWMGILLNIIKDIKYNQLPNKESGIIS